MNEQQSKDLATALAEVFVSPNESDANYEPANVVDGLFAIARAIHRLADTTGQGSCEHPHVGGALEAWASGTASFGCGCGADLHQTADGTPWCSSCGWYEDGAA
jgi:hypothetical protein